VSRLLLSIDDLGDREIRSVLDRAHVLATGEPAVRDHSPLVGLLFLSESTRTRVGFAAAAARLGGSSVEVTSARDGTQMSAAESFEDTVRTLTGMVDLVVVRTPNELDRVALGKVAVAPVISGGHGSVEHPTQALIDVLAIESERGPVGEQRITLCGDLTMRALRSMLRLFERMPPAQLRLVAPPGRSVELSDLSPQLSARTIVSSPDDLADTDVLYLPGLPAGRGADHLDAGARARYAVTTDRLATLSADAVVLCPLPVVDEVDAGARLDPRVRMFEQSDRGVALRVALLEHLLA
jgi:aspartate carbamoyltransferase catalytic subunit